MGASLCWRPSAHRRHPGGVYLQAQGHVRLACLLRVNMRKTKLMISGVGLVVLTKPGKYPCAVCWKGVDNKSIEYSRRKLWVHKTSNSVSGRLMADEHYSCSRCNGKSRTNDTDGCRRPLDVEATFCFWVTCCALVGAMPVPMPPDAAWPGERSGNYCLSSSPGTSRLRCVARCGRPVSARLCSTVAKRTEHSNLERLRRSDCAMFR